MIISKYYNSLNPSKREDLVVGLGAGLVAGLVAGLGAGSVLGLVWGLVAVLSVGLGVGLVVGLGVGLGAGLVAGLVVGLGVGLGVGLVSGLVVIIINWSEALPFLTQFYPISLLVLGIIILSEILFWMMPEEKVSPKNLFWHTTKRKLENVFEVLLGLSGIFQVYIFTREIAKHYDVEVTQLILKWIGYIGVTIVVIALVIGVFYVWIKLNSLKYTLSPLKGGTKT